MIYHPPQWCSHCGTHLQRPNITSFWPGDSPAEDYEIYTEARWGENDFVHNNVHWHCQDGDSTEIEVSRLIAALVTATQPELVIETGAAWGQTTFMIAEALYLNGHGHLVSLEIDAQRLAYSRWYCHEMICTGVMDIVDCSSTEYDPGQRVDFLFSDSDCDLRVPELTHYYKWMDEKSLAVFHDTAPYHCRSLQDKLEAVGDQFRNIRLHTPRGVTIMEVLPCPSSPTTP